MFKRRQPSPPREDPSVAVVEQILTMAAARSEPQVPTLNGAFYADRAVWLCACVTDFDADAPKWLIVETDAGGVGWCRVPDGTGVRAFVVTHFVTGDHVHPGEVLHWLQDRDDRTWPRQDTSDREVIEAMGRKIRDLQAD
ncbi:hypothetical protein [Nocardioides sp. L-11A]|uniref:hypothetical protein n=1 Tax=Nocardioides sp. L-11A TaxID=3043848 RepID=UPI00249BA6AA|nr:hypothetical protein QJ852_00105 [Nocardioides sp. L-11A]